MSKVRKKTVEELSLEIKKCNKELANIRKEEKKAIKLLGIEEIYPLIEAAINSGAEVGDLKRALNALITSMKINAQVDSSHPYYCW